MHNIIPHSSSNVLLNDFSYIKGIAEDNFVGNSKISELFKSELVQYFDKKYAALTTSGTTALELSIYVLKKNNTKAKYVAVSSYVCPAVINAILRNDLKPFFIDTNECSMNICEKQVLELIDDNILAIVLTNIGGFPDNYDVIKNASIPIISDCAQGAGAKISDKQISSLGTVTVLSFSSTKIITAGIGGAVLTNKKPAIDRINEQSILELTIANYIKNGFTETRGQYISDLNSGLGLAQLERLDSILNSRISIANQYSEILSGIVHLPEQTKNSKPNYFRYYFFSTQSKQWLKLFQDKNIDARNSIAHDMSKYFQISNQTSNLKTNVNRLVSLPIYPSLSENQINHILSTLQLGIELGLS